MKNYLKKAFILLGAIISIFAVRGTVYAGTDTTAPVVTKATVKTLSVKKNENIRLDLAVVENDTGIAKIKVGLYCYKSTSASPLLIFGDADYTGEDKTSQYTGTITLDIPVASSDASGKYYIGFIKITDNAGNENTYFEHYDENGYYTVNGAFYLPLIEQTDVKKACLITNGACVTVISDGDDTAPIITNVSFASTKVSKTESIVANMTVIEESDISDVSLTYEGYKNKQRIMIGYWPISWSRSKNIIKAPMELSDEDMAGTYYLSQISITDSKGNKREYKCNLENMKYFTDDNGSYLVDSTNENIKCYVKNGATVQVVSDGDNEAPVIDSITIAKEKITKPGILPMDLKLKNADEIKSISVYLCTYGTEKQSDYNYTEKFDTRERKKNYTIEIPIATTTNVGKYYIYEIKVMDYSGNTRTYRVYESMATKDNPYLSKNGKNYMLDKDDNAQMAVVASKGIFEVEDEFDVDFESALSNPSLRSMIESMEKGKTAKIYIDGKGIATKEMFNAIKGQDKTLVFYNNNYQWVFNGLKVTNPKDIKLKVSFEMADGEEYQTTGNLLKINFADNGKLPGTANVRIKSDYTFKLFKMTGKMYLYYLNNNTDTLSYESKSDIEYVLDGSDHWCQFNITHNSSYMVSGKKIAKNQNIAIKKMTIKSLSKKLAVGKKMKLSVSLNPANASCNKFAWKSSNKKYATVNSNGVVTAKKAGGGKKVKITATAKDGSGKKATITINITKDVVQSIKLKANNKTVKPGKSVNITAKVKTSGKKANKTLKWTSSNTKYATVNSRGKVTAKKAGKGKKVKITAMATDGSGKKATITIKISSSAKK